MTLEAFSIMVRNHNLTYRLDKDKNIWARAEWTLGNIKKAAETIPHEDAVRIWNEEVDRRVAPDAREAYYWQ